jgi:hypothetical protein
MVRNNDCLWNYKVALFCLDGKNNLLCGMFFSASGNRRVVARISFDRIKGCFLVNKSESRLMGIFDANEFADPVLVFLANKFTSPVCVACKQV